MNPRLFSFVGGQSGPWQVVEIRAILGETLPSVQWLDVVNAALTLPGEASWMLRGTTSNERYVLRTEKEQLLAKQAGTGRPKAICATLIPIRKTAAWWALTQDERRKIFEEISKHTEIGLKYLPAIARRLHHCRDLAESEPFDFLTWFEYAPADTSAFDELLGALRATEEWAYVDREVEIRVKKNGDSGN
jgi:chlorite dismutase